MPKETKTVTQKDICTSILIAALFMSIEFIILTVQVIFHKFVFFLLFFSFYILIFIFREITLLVLNAFFMINIKGFPLVALCHYQQEMFLGLASD